MNNEIINRGGRDLGVTAIGTTVVLILTEYGIDVKPTLALLLAGVVNVVGLTLYRLGRKQGWWGGDTTA